MTVVAGDLTGSCFCSPAPTTRRGVVPSPCDLLCLGSDHVLTRAARGLSNKGFE